MVVSKQLTISAIMIVLLSGVALAAPKVVKLKNKHSRAEVQSLCDSMGDSGLAGNTQGKSGSYDCMNLDTGNTVSCDSKGNCKGYIYRKKP
jgi:hypothetical protein